MPSPAEGTKHKRPKIIATSVRTPILELPGPGPANETWKARIHQNSSQNMEWES